MIIILNNKSNLDLNEFKIYQNELNKIESNNEVVLCPSNIYLSNCNLKNILLGSQNVSSYKQGAYTGEIYAKQLSSLGVKYCIVGHSERRKNQKEKNSEINSKIKNLLEEKITPILCIGETKEEKEQNKTIEVLRRELNECLNGIDDNGLIIAYEPIWAIGSGLTPTKEEVEEILSYLKEIYPTNRLIYGGSLNKENIKDFKNSEIIDGYLLGGLSLKPTELQIFLEELE